MGVTYTKEQMLIAKREKIPLVAISIDGRHCTPGCHCMSFHGPTSGEHETFTHALGVFRDYLRKVNPKHPALRLFR